MSAGVPVQMRGKISPEVWETLSVDAGDKSVQHNGKQSRSGGKVKQNLVEGRSDMLEPVGALEALPGQDVELPTFCQIVVSRM